MAIKFVEVTGSPAAKPVKAKVAPAKQPELDVDAAPADDNKLPFGKPPSAKAVKAAKAAAKKAKGR